VKKGGKDRYGRKKTDTLSSADSSGIDPTRSRRQYRLTKTAKSKRTSDQPDPMLLRRFTEQLDALTLRRLNFEAVFRLRRPADPLSVLAEDPSSVGRVEDLLLERRRVSASHASGELMRRAKEWRIRGGRTGRTTRSGFFLSAPPLTASSILARA
jgi:hypothetical protein